MGGSRRRGSTPRSADDVAALCREHAITHVLNAVDPRFVMPIFEGAFAAGADYLDMAMSLSRPDPEAPYERPGVKLGDEQFAQADAWSAAGRLALVGVGVEPGLSDIFARYAQDHLFSEIDEIGVRDGANLVVEGYDFAPSFSIWTTIEECLNPPVIWEADRGWYTTPPFSEPEVFDFPEGIGPVECVNVEHEEVLLIPRWVKAKRVTFKYGLGDEFINVLKVLHMLGLDRTEKVRVGGVEVSPRDVVAAVLPDPAALGDRMRGKTCAGTWVKGTGLDGQPRRGLPLPRGRQRGHDARRRLAGRRLADGDQPGRRARAARYGRLVRGGRPRPGGVRRRAVPRAADRVRVALGDARGRLIAASAGAGLMLDFGLRRGTFDSVCQWAAYPRRARFVAAPHHSGSNTFMPSIGISRKDAPERPKSSINIGAAGTKGSAPERNVSDAGRHLSTDTSIGHALLELRRHLSERSRARRDPGGGARHLFEPAVLAWVGLSGIDRRLPTSRRELEPRELEGGRHDAADQRPGTQWTSRLPCTGGHDRLDDRAGHDIATEVMNGDRRLTLGPDPQLKRIARRVLPDLVGIDPMPVRSLAGRQQVDDRAAAGTHAFRRGSPPRLGIPATFRVSTHS